MAGGRTGIRPVPAPAPSSLLRTSFLLLLLVSATWLLGLLAVNSDVLTFHYLFAIFSCLQVSDSVGVRVGQLRGGRSWVTGATSALKGLDPEGPGGLPGRSQPGVQAASWLSGGAGCTAAVAPERPQRVQATARSPATKAACCARPGPLPRSSSVAGAQPAQGPLPSPRVNPTCVPRRGSGHRPFTPGRWLEVMGGTPGDSCGLGWGPPVPGC